jgi:hypothetical protein
MSALSGWLLVVLLMAGFFGCCIAALFATLRRDRRGEREHPS